MGGSTGVSVVVDSRKLRDLLRSRWMRWRTARGLARSATSWRLIWLLASTSLSMLASARALADCTASNPGTQNNPGVNVVALSPDICDVSGPYELTTTTANAAVQASGKGAVINWADTQGPGPISTTVDGTPAVQADSGGKVTLTGGSVIATLGINAAAVLAETGGSIVLTGGTTILTISNDSPGLAVNGSDSSLAAEDAGVKTNGVAAFGATNAGGVMNLMGTTKIVTVGQDADAVVASGVGAITTLGMENDLSTLGDGAVGLYATAGGVITANAGSVTTAGASDPETPGITTISTGDATNGTGRNAFGAEADGQGSQINLDSLTTVTTSGAGATGLFATGGGTISTTNAASSIATTGDDAAGLYATGAGSAIIAPNGIVVTTMGANAFGAQADSGGALTLGGGSISTAGQGAHALFVSGSGSQANLSGTESFATQGDGAVGLFVTNGGALTATGPITINTAGGVLSTSLGPVGAFGVEADGQGSQINLAATTIATTGEGAAGLYASDGLGTGHGGVITVSGPLGVVTGGSSAYGAWAQSTGSAITLNGPSTFTINSGAFALFASEGGVISTADTLGVVVNGVAAGGVEANGSGSSATLKGPTTIALNGNQNTGLLATAGGAISTQGPTSIAVSGAQSTGVQALSGAVTASGSLNVTTSQASSIAFALRGTSPSIIASGGGTVSAAGSAITFMDAANAVATFDNFNIKSTAGDLIFAEPSTATVNFNNTIANAGAGNLLNATLGSTVAFNANASTLTGAIQTDATSTTNVSLTNGATWTMSASSTTTSLNLANSAIFFSPSGGFKTLTVGSYVGTGANITLNTALGGPNAGSTDQVIINGGSATGLTSLTIKNASGAAGAATTGAGIPVVIVTNGGTTSPTAFHLANNAPILAGGFEYNLDRASNQDWYLVSSPFATVSQIQGQNQNSVTSLAQARLNQLITSRVLGSLLLGANEQVSGCDCGGGFASIGSFSLGSHGRWSLNDSVTLLAGAAFESYYQDGANVRAAPIVAASLRYDPANWGKSRPFFEIGTALSPYIDATYTRYYTNGLTPAQGVGSAVDRSISVFGRIGWVDRLTPVDEVAVFADLVRGWQQSGGYTEAANAVNPFPATVSTGIDRQDVVRFGAQYTHLLFGNIEGNINGAVAYGFDNHFGSRVNVVDFGSVAPFPLLNSAWSEFGGRLGYRFSQNLVMDAFLIGTLGGEIGPTLHAGLGVRYSF